MKDLYEIMTEGISVYEYSSFADDHTESPLTLKDHDRRGTCFTKDLKKYERCKKCGEMVNPRVGCFCEIGESKR